MSYCKCKSIRTLKPVKGVHPKHSSPYGLILSRNEFSSPSQKLFIQDVENRISSGAGCGVQEECDDVVAVYKSIIDAAKKCNHCSLPLDGFFIEEWGFCCHEFKECSNSGRQPSRKYYIGEE